jgi:hypothetical protein
MAYAMWIGKMLMPITPSKVETVIGNKNKTIMLINEGEVNMIKSPGLTSIKTTVTLPHMKYPFATEFQPMSDYLDYFEELKQGKEPFQFILSRCTPNGKLLFDSNISVTLEDYSITDDAKNGFDVDVSISLKQWRDYGTKTVSIERPSDTAPVVKEEKRATVKNPTPKKKKSSKSSSKSKSSKKKTTSSNIIVDAINAVGKGIKTVAGVINKIVSSTKRKPTVVKPASTKSSANKVTMMKK